MEVTAKSILSVDTISKGNDKPWETLCNYVKNNSITEDILFDFKGIEIAHPWISSSFLKLISNPIVHIRIYNDPDTAKAIDKTCILNGYKTGRIENIEPIIPVVMSKEEKEIMGMAEQLQMYFEKEENSATLHIYKRFDQVGVPKTVAYIGAAIKKFIEDTGIKNITLYTKYSAIQTGVLKAVADLVTEAKEMGAILTIVSDDEAISNKLALYSSAPNGEYTEMAKVQLINTRLMPGKVGLLVKYKSGKGKDEFGRSGKGQAVSNRIAIFNKLYKKNGVWTVQVTSYNGHTLCTRSHWYLEHDGEMMKEPMHEVIDIPVTSFGMYNDFIGSGYHFCAPIQYKKEYTTTLYGTSTDGKVYEERLTIPELAKCVFDDFGIEYDHETLEAYIQRTKEILKEAD